MMGRRGRPQGVVRPRSPLVDAVDRRRQEIGWTQQDLADACDTAQSHISSVLRGVSEPTLPVLEKMCAAVGLALVTVYVGESHHGR